MSLRCHSFCFFCHLLCTPREERDRASGYRKRGPKPKRLLLQVTTVSEPPTTRPCLPHLHVYWPSHHLLTLPSTARVLWNKTLSGFVSVEGVGQRLHMDLEPGRSAWDGDSSGPEGSHVANL